MSKVFVLRTHALLSSRGSTLKFGNDNTIVIPLAVVDELQTLKKQDSFEKKRIAKELLNYIRSFPADKLMSKEGVEQENGSILRVVTDYRDIFVNTENLSSHQVRTLQVCVGIKEEEKRKVILVTNNATLQMQAENLGIKAECFKDEIFPHLNEQYKGREEVSVIDATIDEFYERGFINKEDILNHEQVEFVNNKFFILRSMLTSKSALGVFKNGKIIPLRHQGENPYGLSPKNVGQKFMLEALLDDECPLVIIKGNAGTGKTICTLAAGLEGHKQNKYSRILVTRSVTATEQYGYLPGDIDEKLSPYLAGIKDNLSILSQMSGKGKGNNQRDGLQFFNQGIVQIQAIGFLRGRSIVDSYFIIDETQNIEPDTIKSIVTRAGEGSKFIFLGDPTQIDNPSLTERNNGLVYLSEKMKGNPLCSQVSLMDNESVRSKLAREAAKIL